MTSKERIRAAWSGRDKDRVPLTTWCFGFKPPGHLIWKKNGKTRAYWYSLRIEDTCTLTDPWDLQDEFNRVLAWQSAGVDDVLDISMTWGRDPEVSWKDSLLEPSGSGEHPVMVREYQTPSGKLRHAVKRTSEKSAEGWVVQPDHVPLFEDFNIPRGVEHAVSKPEDVPLIRHLYSPPGKAEKDFFHKRLEKMKEFAEEHGVALQVWAAFGMDAVVWLAGVQGAVFMAMDNPEVFRALTENIYRTDYARTEVACSDPAVDIIVQRGWYSSIDFWSPKLFDDFVYPYISGLAKLCHKHNKRFGYVMTTGVEQLGERLIQAGVDVLYFIDPVQDTITLRKALELFDERITMVGGINAVTLLSGSREAIRKEVQTTLEVMSASKRFILHPVDAIFPDTPWESVEVMINTWKEWTS
jgi:hypothetical protein